MGKNGKFYYNKKKKSAPKVEQNVVQVNYTLEQLELTLDDLGLSDLTKQLLSSNRINKAIDLVNRTEKDMYKVQGLNKKILFEVKDKLKAKGLSLLVVEEKNDNKNKVDANKPVEQKDKKKPQNKIKDLEIDTEIKSKFGLSEKVQQPKQQQVKKERPVEIEDLPSDGLRKVMKGGKWGYSDGNKLVIPTMYDEIFAFKEDLAVVEIDEKCGFIDRENNIVIPFEYDMALSFSEGLALVAKGEKCGYINKNNEVVIDFKYDAGTPFEEGEAKVKKEGKWATLTKDGTLTWIV